MVCTNCLIDVLNSFFIVTHAIENQTKVMVHRMKSGLKGQDTNILISGFFIFL